MFPSAAILTILDIITERSFFARRGDFLLAVASLASWVATEFMLKKSGPAIPANPPLNIEDVASLLKPLTAKEGHHDDAIHACPWCSILLCLFGYCCDCCFDEAKV